jgi:hypothetical protein
MMIADVNASAVAKTIDMKVEVRVKGMKILRARIWLGCWFMRFGAWVVGVGRCEITELQ